MVRRFLIWFCVVVLAITVLFISIYRTTVNRYHFLPPNDSSVGQPVFVSGVEYSLPYPGILPDHPLWFLKATRERLDLYFTSDPLEKAQRTLFVADKRLSAAEELFKKGKYGMAVSTADKAEKYLSNALERAQDADVRGKGASGLFETLFKASLAHREVIENMMSRAPEDAKPLLNKSLDHSRIVFTQTKRLLDEKGKAIPIPSTVQ